MGQRIPGHLTLAELEHLLRLRFTPDDHGVCPCPFEVIKRDPLFKSYDQPTLTRAVQFALNREHPMFDIEIIRRDRYPQHDRDEVLEKQLRDSFTLDSAIVVNPPTQLTSDTAAQSDEIHKRLGYALAQIVSAGNFIKDKERIAIGSGRAVYYTIAYLSTLPSFNAHNVMLFPVAGALYPQHHALLNNVRLDADYHVQLLASRFRFPVDMRFISHPVVSSEPRRIMRLLRQWVWTRTATIAIVGVGVLSQGHRLYDFIKRPHAGVDPMLRPIMAPLTTVIELAEPYTTATYCPVADVANHLLYIEGGPRDPVIPDQVKRRMKSGIAHINEKLIAFGERDLTHIERIILVGGTSQKAAAIYTLLKRTRLKIKMLCTDAVTAEEICERCAAAPCA